MVTKEYRGVLEAALGLTGLVLRNGKTVNIGRTGNIKEVINVNYIITNPQRRILNTDGFKQYRLWAQSEVMTEMLGINPPLMEYYTKDPNIKSFMQSFHRGDNRHNYIYGERWHNNQAFQRIIERLKKDRYSRQAVMNIYDSSVDLDNSEWNIPCTITHQFLIRPDPDYAYDRMHMIVYLRSNDLFTGWKYDMFLNCFLLEAFAGFMNCDLGNLYVNTGSLHVYEKDIVALEQWYNKISSESMETIADIDISHSEIPFGMPFNELYNNLWLVKSIEEETRYTHKRTTYDISSLHDYFFEWAHEYERYNVRRGK